ncbi:MAG TPA: ATP-binding protein [Kofleriaceae bacterium]|nr:ATP-binding protein [Kofleriaceae bacterium]
MTAPPVDRSAAALAAAGQRIMRSRVAGQIRAALRDGVISLLGAERCSVVDLAVGEPPWPVEGDAGPVPAALINAALRAGHPVVWPSAELRAEPAIEPAAGAAAVRPAPRALCAPIAVGGRPSAVLYATRSDRGAGFGDDERALAGFLTALAGSALENASELLQIQDHADNLEHSLQVRTEELAATGLALDDSLRQLATNQEQLLHAGRMAAVGTMFAGLSHELNNPLAVIIGNVDNLRLLTRPDEPIARVIDAIDRQATRAARLVSALLRFSRIGSVGHEQVAPDELVRLVVDLLAAEARRREIDLRVTIAEGLNPLVVVRHAIESALVNITTNALQATPEGGVVELSVFADVRDGVSGIRFVARDTGVGIAPEILPQIFDPFFTTKPEGEGTGLGLSLARDIATAHGGQLAVETAVGRGTTMSLWLPEFGAGPRPRRTPAPR